MDFNALSLLYALVVECFKCYIQALSLFKPKKHSFSSHSHTTIYSHHTTITTLSFFSYLKLNISNKLNKEWLISILYELAIEILAWFTQKKQKITLLVNVLILILILIEPCQYFKCYFMFSFIGYSVMNWREYKGSFFCSYFYLFSSIWNSNAVTDVYWKRLCFFLW